MICDRCNWLISDGCTCHPKPDAERDVERRHRAAVRRARAHGWAGNALRHPHPQTNPTGRRWAA